MLEIINAQPEAIKLHCDEGSISVPAQGTVNIPVVSDKNIITIMHSDFLAGGSGVEKIIGGVAKASMLIIDSTFCVTEIRENASLTITNETYEHSTSDFGYLFFSVQCNNCKCSLYKCRGVNSKQVLRMQKLMRFDEASDFPPFSTVGAVIRYRKIKKMCCDSEIFSFLKNAENEALFCNS